MAIEVRNRKVLIVGFGKSGQAAARYCLEHGAFVTVTDMKPEGEFDLSGICHAVMLSCGHAVGQQNSKTARQQDKDTSRIEFHFGSHPTSLFEEADIIVVSPGVPLTIDGIRKAKERGIPVVGEMELADFEAPIIAITGTNGKSTVTTLVGEILKEAGKKVLIGGNIGTPLIALIAAHDARRTTHDAVVLEVSSYQLEISPSFHPLVAVLLNITPDHLDRYPSYEAYIEAKALITKNLTSNDYFVFNEEDPIVRKIAERTVAKKVGFSVKKVAAELYLERSREVALPCSRRACSASKASFAATNVVDLSKAKITGLHNKENMIAAALTANIVGCDANVIQKVFERFAGLPHRNQFVREVRGVKFFDDSKGTNVGAVAKSLEGFDSKVVLIAGGLDKGGSYDPLRPLVKQKVRALVLIGDAREEIAKALGDITEVVMADNMAAAVMEAYGLAHKGDVVLLSPACASFDMFRDYAHRGEVFIEEVNKLV